MFAGLVTEWWATVGQTGQFPRVWEEGVLSLAYKKVPQHDLENYRSVCLLSHEGKVVDATMLAAIAGHFTPSQSQFGFQREF